MMSSTCTALVAPVMSRGERAPGRGRHLLGIADDMVDLGHRGEGLGFGLGGAAGHDDPGGRVLAPQPADVLPRLAHGLGRHRAGVDDTASPSPAAVATSFIASVS
jgi:hypothetical protein